MLLLTTTSDEIRVTTDSAATVDVHASFADRAAGVDTAGSQNTAISSVATTTVVSPPGGSVVRNVRRLRVRNKSAATSVTVTVELYNGTAYELEKRVLGPGQGLEFTDQGGFLPLPTGGVQTRPHFGVVAGAMGNGDPGQLLSWVQNGAIISPTAANISVTVARCSSFILPFDMTVNRIRCYGVATLAATFKVAIYRMSDLARLTADLTFSTTAATWTSIGATLGVALAKDVCYFIACTANAATATAGPAAFGTTVAATTGQIATAPTALPGSLVQGATNYQAGNLFQFAVTAGALPNPAAALAAQGAWTGGMPAFWLDSADV